nr:uncharacterized protein LOC123857911 [Mirounga angustirostris]
MHRRVYKRVPPQVRGQVWILLLDIEKVKSTNQGVYEFCPQKMKEQAQLFSKDIRQIDLDVNRTFRNHVMVRDHYGVSPGPVLTSRDPSSKCVPAKPRPRADTVYSHLRMRLRNGGSRWRLPPPTGSSLQGISAAPQCADGVGASPAPVGVSGRSVLLRSPGLVLSRQVRGRPRRCGGPAGGGEGSVRPDRWGAAGSPREKALCLRGRRLAVVLHSPGPWGGGEGRPLSPSAGAARYSSVHRCCPKTRVSILKGPNWESEPEQGGKFPYPDLHHVEVATFHQGWLLQEVGYCQGMSQIVGVLLMLLCEEVAFWALAQLMTTERHVMHGFFIPGLPKLLRFQAHHSLIKAQELPKLKKHLDEEQMCTGIYTAKWFLQCFIDQVRPPKLTCSLFCSLPLAPGEAPAEPHCPGQPDPTRKPEG